MAVLSNSQPDGSYMSDGVWVRPPGWKDPNTTTGSTTTTAASTTPPVGHKLTNAQPDGSYMSDGVWVRPPGWVDPNAAGGSGAAPPADPAAATTPAIPASTVPASAWTQQDDSVANKITGMLAEGSPLLDAAQTKNVQQYNARGLSNSSMAVQGGTEAAINTALPIATTDANNTASKNLAVIQGTEALRQGAQTGQVQKDITAAQIQGQQTVTGMQTGSQERISTQQTQAQIEQNNATIAANHDNILAQLGSNEKISAGQLAMNKEIAGLQLTSQEKIDANDLKAAMDRTQVTNASNQTIAGMNVGSATQTNVSSAVANANAAYTTAFNGIMANPNISATDRATYLESIKNQMTATINIIQTIFNVDLKWTPPTTSTTTAPQINLNGVP